MGCQPKTVCKRKALEKSIVARVVPESGLGLVNDPKWNEEDNEFDPQRTDQEGNLRSLRIRIDEKELKLDSWI